MNARLLALVRRESLSGPVGRVLPNFMRISFDDSQQFGFPGRCDPSLPTRGRAPEDGIQSTAQEALEDTYHRVLATQHDLGNLARRLASLREQEHLIARARFDVRCFFVATVQFGQRWLLLLRQR